MKILYLTSRFPYPLEKGDKLRAFHQIKALSEKHDVYLISLTDQDPPKADLEELHQYCKEVHLFFIRPVKRYWSLFRAIFTKIPFQIAYFYNRETHRNIESLTNKIQPDHIFCQLARMSEYAKNLNYPKTLDYMDCFGVSMKKRAKVAGKISSLFYKAEAQRMTDYEKEIADSFDHLTIISEQDKGQFNFDKAKEITVIPNGISSYFTDYKEQHSPKYDLVFIGNMSYLPNIESAEFIVNNIIPHLPRKIRVLISGAQPHNRIKKLASEQVTVSGWVEDIRQAYKSGKIFVAPMWTGTGQQNKILEAMALGIPCITTNAVNNAIGAKENEQILISETAEEFVHNISKLMDNNQLYNSISVESQKFVTENFSWNTSESVLSSIFAQHQHENND